MKNTRIAIAVLLALGIIVAGLYGCTVAEPEPVVEFESQAVRERTAINTAEDSYIKYGADIIWYSDNRSTQTVAIDGANGDVDVGGSINFGTGNLYPLGYATDGYEMVCATTTFTGENQTIAVSDLTAVKRVVATMSQDPGTGAGDPALVTVDTPGGSAASFVANCFQDDWTTAATSSVTIEYCAIGTK